MSVSTRRHLAAVAILTLTALTATPALSQPASTWPERPVRLVVPVGAGGAADTLARNLANGFSQFANGQPLVVENRPGGGGTLGAEAGARAQPDGYTIMIAALPVLAIVPLINSVFGGGMGARIFVCVMISIFPIVTNTLFGLTSVDTSMHELFTLRGVSRRTRLTKLQFPAALPSIFVGFRIAAGLSVIGAIVGEQFFRSGQKPGIGVVAELFRQKSRFPQLYGALIVAVLLGITVFFFFGVLRKLVIGRWYDD
jgi:ABC-type proline/glycine betaine transport system permease subunit